MELDNRFLARNNDVNFNIELKFVPKSLPNRKPTVKPGANAAPRSNSLTSHNSHRASQTHNHQPPPRLRPTARYPRSSSLTLTSSKDLSPQDVNFNKVKPKNSFYFANGEKFTPRNRQQKKTRFEDAPGEIVIKKVNPLRQPVAKPVVAGPKSSPTLSLTNSSSTDESSLLLLNAQPPRNPYNDSIDSSLSERSAEVKSDLYETSSSGTINIDDEVEEAEKMAAQAEMMAFKAREEVKRKRLEKSEKRRLDESKRIEEVAKQKVQQLKAQQYATLRPRADLNMGAKNSSLSSLISQEREAEIMREAEAKAKKDAEQRIQEAEKKAQQAKLALRVKQQEEDQRRADLEAREAQLKAREELLKLKEIEKKKHKAKRQAEQVARAKAEQEAQEANRKAQREREIKEQELIAKEQESRAKQEAELRAKQEAELRARQKADLETRQRLQKEAKWQMEIKAAQEAELKFQQEADLRAKKEAEEKKRQEVKSRKLAEKKFRAQKEALIKEKKEADQKAKILHQSADKAREAEAKAVREAEKLKKKEQKQQKKDLKAKEKAQDKAIGEKKEGGIKIGLVGKGLVGKVGEISKSITLTDLKDDAKKLTGALLKYTKSIREKKDKTPAAQPVVARQEVPKPVVKKAPINLDRQLPKLPQQKRLEQPVLQVAPVLREVTTPDVKTIIEAPKSLAPQRTTFINLDEFSKHEDLDVTIDSSFLDDFDDFGDPDPTKRPSVASVDTSQVLIPTSSEYQTIEVDSKGSPEQVRTSMIDTSSKNYFTDFDSIIHEEPIAKQPLTVRNDPESKTGPVQIIKDISELGEAATNTFDMTDQIGLQRSGSKFESKKMKNMFRFKRKKSVKETARSSMLAEYEYQFNQYSEMPTVVLDQKPTFEEDFIEELDSFSIEEMPTKRSSGFFDIENLRQDKDLKKETKNIAATPETYFEFNTDGLRYLQEMIEFGKDDVAIDIHKPSSPDTENANKVVPQEDPAPIQVVEDANYCKAESIIIKPNVRFSNKVHVAKTYSKLAYDRLSEKNSTCFYLHPLLIEDIKIELNAFKKEMDIHPTSKDNTHFFNEV